MSEPIIDQFIETKPLNSEFTLHFNTITANRHLKLNSLIQQHFTDSLVDEPSSMISNDFNKLLT